MTKRPFFFPGSLPFHMLAEHLAKDERFLSDAKILLAIDNTQFDRVAAALAENDAFLDRRTLASVVAGALDGTQDAPNLSRIIRGLSTMLRDADEPLNKAVTLLQEAVNKWSTEIPENDRKILGERIEALAATPVALARQHKAEQLAEATGLELEDVQILCDIRPVFNESRSQIEGAVPISTLKLDVLEWDGTSSTVELRLTEQQITDLCAKAELAKTKIAVIKKTLEKQSIPVPFTSATMDERIPT